MYQHKGTRKKCKTTNQAAIIQWRRQCLMYKPHRKPWPKSKTSDISKQSPVHCITPFCSDALALSALVCIAVEKSPNASSIYIRLCKHRKKVFYCFYKINFPRKDAKLLWHWLKEKFLLVAKSCPRSLARVISSCFTKGCFPKYGLFSLKMSA